MRRIVMICVVLTTVLVTSCSSAADTTIAETGRLTPEGESYQVTTVGDRMVVTNKASGRNNREIYWDPSGPVSSSATQCTTWQSGQDIAQNGMAFRIAPQSFGLLRNPSD